MILELRSSGQNFVEAFSSFLSGSLLRACYGFQLTSSTSTNESNSSDRFIRLSSTGPGSASLMSTEVALVDRQRNLSSLSYGVQLVVVKSGELMECRASEKAAPAIDRG